MIARSGSLWKPLEAFGSLWIQIFTAVDLKKHILKIQYIKKSAHWMTIPMREMYEVWINFDWHCIKHMAKSGIQCGTIFSTFFFSQNFHSFLSYDPTIPFHVYSCNKHLKTCYGEIVLVWVKKFTHWKMSCQSFWLKKQAQACLCSAASSSIHQGNQRRRHSTSHVRTGSCPHPRPHAAEHIPPSPPSALPSARACVG